MSKTNRPPHEPADLRTKTGDERTVRTRNSMLWAAYADALGFISELVDHKGLRRRTRGQALNRLMAWKRRVGGRSGVDVELPAGCWSDDTQLRMAVSRAISRHGFDVESFARIELPVWPSYALGGGRASKAAAANLGKPDALWYANTYPGWFNAGGNGAAMRVQPHVWSSRDLNSDYMLDVIADSVCTHGHPRAIVGACFHAATLAHCLRVGTAPGMDECMEIAIGIRDHLRLIESHRSLGTTWISLWEKESDRQLRDVWHATVDELCMAISKTALDAGKSTSHTYQEISDRLGLTVGEQRGSGILTPVAAAALAAIAPTTHEAVVTAANAVGTDTDTIATMAGALLGACSAAGDPPDQPLDSAYLLSEADRLVAISRGHKVGNHSYPDVLTWVAPQTQADALVSADAQLAVEGLGPVTEMDTGASWAPRRDFAWQWVQTNFGQTLLIKRRPDARSSGVGNAMTPPSAPPSGPRPRGTAKAGSKPTTRAVDAPLDRGVNVDTAVDYAKHNIADNGQLGYTVRRVARDGTLSDLVALVTALRDDLRR